MEATSPVSLPSRPVSEVSIDIKCLVALQVQSLLIHHVVLWPFPFFRKSHELTMQKY